MAGGVLASKVVRAEALPVVAVMKVPVSSEENCLLEVNILLASLKPPLSQGPERLASGSPHLRDRWEIWPLTG